MWGFGLGQTLETTNRRSQRLVSELLSSRDAAELSVGLGRLEAVDGEFFDRVREVVRGAVPRALGEPRIKVRHNGVKVWFGEAVREHYEAQVIRPDGVPGAEDFALEVGFHTEYGKAEENEAVLARLRACEPRWRAELGDEPVAGEFLGHRLWRRVSETWPDPVGSGPDLSFEVGVRLVDYIRAIEPLRG